MVLAAVLTAVLTGSQGVAVGVEEHLQGGEPAVSDDGVVASGASIGVAWDAVSVGSAQGVVGADPLGAQGAVGLRGPADAESGASGALAVGRRPLDDEVASARRPDVIDG